MAYRRKASLKTAWPAMVMFMGGLILYEGGPHILRDWKLHRAHETTLGVVTEVRQYRKRQRGTDPRQFDVSYRFEVGSRMVQSTETGLSRDAYREAGRVEEGDTVPVLYSPADPHVNHPDWPLGRYAESRMYTELPGGLVLLLLGGVVLLRRRFSGPHA